MRLSAGSPSLATASRRARRVHRVLTVFGRSINLAIMLGMVQVAKKIPFEDPNVLNACRAVYVISNLIIAGIYLFIQSQINKKKGMGHLRAPLGPL